MQSHLSCVATQGNPISVVVMNYVFTLLEIKISNRIMKYS